MLKLDFLGEESKLKNKHYKEGNATIVPYPCYRSDECNPYQVSFPPGTFLIELFGASGGNFSSHNAIGGKGGKISAVISSKRRESFYLYIGGHGENAGQNETPSGGYNGGGTANQYRGGGGGASDLRKIVDDIGSRIIVAGAGGGAYYNAQKSSCNGGHGGGLSGTQGDHHGSVSDRPCYGSTTSCEGGAGATYPGYQEFGSDFLNNSKSGGGGGAGWWGGGSAESCASSGGSSYSHSSLMIFQTISGVNSGNGFARIIFLGYLSPSCHPQLIRKNNILFTFIIVSLLC